MPINRSDSNTFMDTSKVVASTSLSISFSDSLGHHSRLHQLRLPFRSSLIHSCQNQQVKQQWTAKWIAIALHLAFQVTSKFETTRQPLGWIWMDRMFHTGHVCPAVSHFLFSFLLFILFCIARACVTAKIIDFRPLPLPYCLVLQRILTRYIIRASAQHL